MRASASDRFWSKVRKGGENECWVWNGKFHPGLNQSQFFVGVRGGKGRIMTAARFAFLEAHNLDGLSTSIFVARTCGNSRCVNPAHGKLSTRRGFPAVKKGRREVGEVKARAIRVLSKAGFSTLKISEILNVGYYPALNVVRNKSYKSVA